MTSLSFKLSVTAALVVALQSCTADTGTAAPENQITLNNMENLEGWAPATPTLTKEKAHSGRFSIKVDQTEEFGLGYVNFLGKISPSRLSKLTLKAWAYRAGAESKAAMVVQIVDPANPSKQVFWQSLDLTAEVKTFNRWTEVQKSFELPNTLAPTQQLRVYLWRTGGTQPTYIDDLELVRE